MTEAAAAAPPGILPNDPNHTHNALYRNLLQDVQGAVPGHTAEQQASVAASLVIELVATYDQRSGRWQEPTEQQLASVRRLVGTLQNNYGLNDRDIHEHDAISYKTLGEGAGLYRPEPRAVDAPGVQQQQAAPGR